MVDDMDSESAPRLTPVEPAIDGERPPTTKAGNFQRALILAVDAESYGGRQDAGQATAQEDLLRVLAQAAVLAGLNRGAWWRTRGGGDGELAVLPSSEPEVAVVDDFVRHLANEVRKTNRSRSADYQLRLRLAVHFGRASVAANGYSGEGPVTATRMRDSPAAKKALSACSCDLVVLYSRSVFEDVIEQRYTTLLPERLKAVRVNLKETETTAWLWLPPDGYLGRPPGNFGHFLRHLRWLRVAAPVLLVLSVSILLAVHFAPRETSEPSGRFIEPPADARVSNRIDVHGVARVPEGNEVWVLLRPPDNAFYTVTAHPAPLTVAANGQWTLRGVGLGKDAGDVGRQYELVLVAIDGGEFDQAVATGRVGRLSARFERLPPKAELLDSVTVRLASWSA